MSERRAEREKLVKMLQEIQDEVAEFYRKFKAETELQSKTTEKMTTLVQRYNILARGVPSKRTYPIEASNDIEDAIRTDFHSQVGIVDESNFMLTTIVSYLNNTYEKLDTYLGKVNIVNIEYLDGVEVTQQAISQRIEMLMDFIKYLTRAVSKLNSSASLLNLDKIKSVEEYKAALKPNRMFDDYFQTYLAIQNQSSNYKKKTIT